MFFSICFRFISFGAPEAEPGENKPKSICGYCRPCEMIPNHYLRASHKSNEDKYPAEYLEKCFHFYELFKGLTCFFILYENDSQKVNRLH